MKTTYSKEADDFLPDIISTGCMNSIKLKKVKHRVPCGKCLPCKRKRRSDWTFRLWIEQQNAISAYFITLTYNDIFIPRTLEGYQTLRKKDLQGYLKRLRDEHTKLYCKTYEVTRKEARRLQNQLRYYAVGEYGSQTRRPHYHILLFNYEPEILDTITDQWKDTKTNQPLGIVDVGTVNPSSIHYVTKYMQKDFNRKTDKRNPPFNLMSRKPYIGYQYVEKYGQYHYETNMIQAVNHEGRKQMMPKLFLSKIWINEEERQYLIKKTYENFLNKKIENFNKQMDHYESIDQYMQSMVSDAKRRQKQIKETL